MNSILSSKLLEAHCKGPDSSRWHYFYQPNGKNRFVPVKEVEQELSELSYCLHAIEKTSFPSNQLEFRSTKATLMESLTPKIESLSRFMTEKPVRILIKKDTSMKRGIQETFQEDVKADGVCLFSGGVDSTVGMLLLERDQSPVVLSHTKTGDISLGRARTVFKEVGAQFSLVVSDATFSRSDYLSKPGVSVAHSRGLLFLINAAIVANSLGLSRVILPENGPFVLNIETAMFDKSTRTTHPLLIRTLTDVIREATGRQIQIEMPFSHWTKAEIMTSHVLDRLLRHTHSCFHTQNQPGNTMCGLCYSCFVRRLSAHAAGVEALDGEYRDNLFKAQPGPGSDRKKLEIAHRVLRFYSKGLSDRKRIGNRITPLDRGYRYTAPEAEELLLRFASDLLLGSKRMLDQMKSTTLGPLGEYAEGVLSTVDNEVLHKRADQLENLRNSDFDEFDFSHSAF